MTSNGTLANFRGEFPTASQDARRIAAALDVPGCRRRIVLDACRVNIDKLGRLFTGKKIDRQSPYAITRGNEFEKRVLDNGMANILALARKHLGLTIPEAREKDLSRESLLEEFPNLPRKGKGLNEFRANHTQTLVAQMLRDPSCATNLLRHPMTKLGFGGEVAYLEQDVLAFTVKGRIHVVEIKSYPKVDGVADPTKVSSTQKQAAVYVSSLKQLATSIGVSPEVVDTNVMLVLPENLTFNPTAAVIDTSSQLQRLHRQLAQIPNVSDILSSLEPGISLPPEPNWKDPIQIESAISVAGEALSNLPPRFCDNCVSCPLFQFCREEAENQQLVARLGTSVAGACGSITTIDAAIDFANGRRQPANDSEAAAAAMLARGAAALKLVASGS